MKTEDMTVLDAALGVFLRYGFKRSTMGDIAQAAGLSRQSLYARYANKDEVYAAGLELHAERTIAALNAAWATSNTMGGAMDIFAQIAVVPLFDMLQSNPDASDMIEGAETPEGRAAMGIVTKNVCAALANLFAPSSDVLTAHGLTPGQLAEFVEMSKHAMFKHAADRSELDMHLATLKATVVAVTAR